MFVLTTGSRTDTARAPPPHTAASRLKPAPSPPPPSSLTQRRARGERRRTGVGRGWMQRFRSPARREPPLAPGQRPPRAPTRTHLLGLFGEGLGRPHHHVGAGVLVLR